MENTIKSGSQTAFYLHIALIVLAVLGIFLSFMELTPAKFFTFYTQDSNMFSLIVSIIYVATYKKGISPLTKKLRFAATSCLMLTFFVVILVLGPSYGVEFYPWLLFHGANFLYHVACPLLSLVSFIIFEDDQDLEFIDTLKALIPTLIYAVIIIFLNIIYVVDGPYPFLKVHDQSVLMSMIWFLVILGFNWLITLGVRRLKNVKGLE